MPLTSLQNYASWDKKKWNRRWLSFAHPYPSTVSVVVAVSWSVHVILLGRAFDIGNTLISQNWKLITSSKQNLWPWGVGAGCGVTVSRETFPLLRVYTVKLMLATFGPIQSRPNYTGGQITETTWCYENWTVLYPLCKCTVQSEQTDGSVGKQILCIILSMIRGFKYSYGSVASRKFLYVVRTCGEGWKLSGQMAFLLMTEDSGPCEVWHKNCTAL